jgi:putative glutamine amidotransferase
VSDIKPLIGIICNFREENNHKMHTVGDRYITSVLETCAAVPIAIPAFGDDHDVDGLLAHLDGVILTGGRSNIEPSRYGGPDSRDTVEHDPRRDGTAIQLVRGAVAHAVPLFGVCRGIQEMNVALGGTLHQHLHEVEGRFDHRMERHQPLSERLRPRQRITIEPGGVLSKLLSESTAVTNTLHGQGIDQLAPGLRLEALADDGTVEAVSITAAESFAVGVQWHAEYEPLDHCLYKALFQAFGEAARERQRRRFGAREGVIAAD